MTSILGVRSRPGPGLTAVLRQNLWWPVGARWDRKIPFCWTVMEVDILEKVPLVLFERFNSLSEVCVKLGHTAGEEWIHDRTRKQTSKISLEEADKLSFTCFPVSHQINRTKTNSHYYYYTLAKQWHWITKYSMY